jgi:hypothetical protein
VLRRSIHFVLTSRITIHAGGLQPNVAPRRLRDSDVEFQDSSLEHVFMQLNAPIESYIPSFSCYFAAAVLLLSIIKCSWKVWRMRDWKSVIGVITQTGISTKQLSGELSNEIGFNPDISYRYVVGGMEFIGNKIGQFPNPIASLSNAQKAIETYPEGSSVTVFYNPQNPSESVLSRSGSPIIIILALCGLLFLIFAMAFWPS